MDEASTSWERRPALVEDLQQHLRHAIFSGHYAPGTRLRQEQLAEELNVSRTPLREALRVLESEGLLTSTRGRGMVVATATPETLLEASEFREVVDGVAARLAAERGDEALNERLEGAIAAQKSALEPWNKVQFMENDAEFHVAILKASGNQYVAAQTAVIRLATQVFRPVLGFDSHDAERSIHEHQRIAEAIKVGDGIGAEFWARAHIRVGISAISHLPDQDLA